MCYLQACVSTFHPGNFTGCGSERVKERAAVRSCVHAAKRQSCSDKIGSVC